MTGITTLRRGSGPGQIALQSDSLPPLPKCRTYKWATGFSCCLICRLLHTSCMSTNSLRHTNTGTLSTTRAHGYSHSQETIQGLSKEVLGSTPDQLIVISKSLILRLDQAFGGSDQGRSLYKIYKILNKLSQFIILR